MTGQKAKIKLGNTVISDNGDFFVIAEIGHNHQGDLDIAMKMIDVAAECGVQAVKFQKRNNKTLYVSDMYKKPYDNENSFGKTYGEHREALEFDKKEYHKLKKHAEEKGLLFIATAFDFESADLLDEIGVSAYKVASGDITNYPLLEYIAKKRKPVFLSTGACMMDEVRNAYNIVKRQVNQLCIMQCTAGYPVEDYNEVNLKTIETYKHEFPDAIIGYSGHENGIVIPVVAYVLGATVIEKHFTLNRAMKGTDHKFSLEPQGLTKMVRDLKRVKLAMGTGKKIFYPSERDARRKMGKSIVLSRPVKAGVVLKKEMLSFKCPGDGIPPSELDHVLNKTIIADLPSDTILLWQHLK
jgi:sialic acid synthase